jgi:cholesterol transport system auxiliary component
MRSRIIKFCACLNLIVILLMTFGCGPKPYNKRYYALGVQHQAKTTKSDNKFILDVRSFTIDSAFESKALVYRKGNFEYESDFYNEFLVSPAIMITEKTRNWLAASGIFERVLDKGNYIEPNHTLEGNITALYSDLREHKAIIEMRIFLIANIDRKESTILARTYRTSRGLKSETTESLIEAFDICLKQILSDLEEDLREKL